MSMYLLIICFNRHCVFLWIGAMDWSPGLESSWIGVLGKFNSIRDTIYVCANGGHFKTCNKCINFY